jgi:hypothetical protein
MNDPSRLRDRYLRDPLRVRLGGLAVNLARVRSFLRISVIVIT